MMLQIREAVETDLDQMLRIWKMGGGENKFKINHFNEEVFKKNFHSTASPFSYWVALSDEQLVGWSSLLPAFLNPIKLTNAEISIYVDQENASVGTGFELMKHTLEYAKKSEIDEVWAFVVLTNEPAIRMCNKSEMRLCGKTMFKAIFHFYCRETT